MSTYTLPCSTLHLHRTNSHKQKKKLLRDKFHNPRLTTTLSVVEPNKGYQVYMIADIRDSTYRKPTTKRNEP